MRRRPPMLQSGYDKRSKKPTSPFSTQPFNAKASPIHPEIGLFIYVGYK